VVNDTRAGRHRPATPYNPVTELSTILRSAGETSVKASAVLAASGGLVATFSLPAQANPSEAAARATATAAASPAPAEPVALGLAPAVVAPEPASPVASEAIGVAGLKAVAKPKPAPRPAPVEEAVAERTSTSSTPAASRTTTRSAPVSQSSSEVVNIARTLLGIAYVYGGETPAGFDCSGFTQYVFGKAGVSIPRTASAQQSAATPVSDPQPGDLVFYGYPAWHVGIYTGNGMMIDSPREGKFTSERPLFSGVTGYGRF
jgi:cell wall-associated NlpC family hydrolase